MSMQSVLTAIYEKVNPATGEITGFKFGFGGGPITRGRIFQNEASQDTVLPLCVFTVASEETTAYLGQTAASIHELVVNFTMYFRMIDGIEVGMVRENTLFDLLHMQAITSADKDIDSIKSVCTSRGTPTIEVDSVSISCSYRVLVSKKA